MIFPHLVTCVLAHHKMALPSRWWSVLAIFLFVITVLALNMTYLKPYAHFIFPTSNSSLTTERIVETIVQPIVISQFAINSPYPPNNSYISFSLYGTKPIFLVGTVRNVLLAKHVYPGWRVKVYHDNSVPEDAIQNIIDAGAEVVNVTGREDLKGIHPRKWRFLIADDENVDVFICRDADSRVNIRERCAVEEWLESSKIIHVMKDHSSYYPRPIRAGMWGMKRKEFFSQLAPNTTMLQLMKSWKTNSTDKVSFDEFFLRDVIWPLANNSALVHDSYWCHRTPGAVGFPCPRLNGEYIGQKYNENDWAMQYVNKTTPVQCRRRPEFIYG